MPEKISIFWFRQDLRLADNPGLTAAATAAEVLPVYILDDMSPKEWATGAASRWWLHHSLQMLSNSLQGRLLILQGNPLQLLPALAEAVNAKSVHWNRCYESWRINLDTQLKQILLHRDIDCSSHKGTLLWEPWQVLKADGSPYKVFTPFFNRACQTIPEPRQPLPPPQPLDIHLYTGSGVKIEDLALLPEPDWTEGLARTWQHGETAAQQVLDDFVSSGLDNYRDGRDYPALRAVSRLSPYLHSGELSPHQVWCQVHQESQSRGLEHQGEHFLRELAWREFSYYLLYHFPQLSSENLQAKFDGFPWREDKKAFKLWTSGVTGYPIVDAGMRELWQTGYMHNRVRLIVASFLVKNLMIHWRHGAAWFWDCLVDADLANNSASWQWVAGSGADAAPYYRIFNPVTQSKKFDAQGLYIRKFVPELAALPDKYIHDPGNAPVEVLQRARVQLGDNYPAPCIDLKTSRIRALEAFKAL